MSHPKRTGYNLAWAELILIFNVPRTAYYLGEKMSMYVWKQCGKIVDNAGKMWEIVAKRVKNAGKRGKNGKMWQNR